MLRRGRSWLERFVCNGIFRAIGGGRDYWRIGGSRNLPGAEGRIGQSPLGHLGWLCGVLLWRTLHLPETDLGNSGTGLAHLGILIHFVREPVRCFHRSALELKPVIEADVEAVAHDAQNSEYHHRFERIHVRPP